jgi:hypothetical protein
VQIVYQVVGEIAAGREPVQHERREPCRMISPGRIRRRGYS